MSSEAELEPENLSPFWVGLMPWGAVRAMTDTHAHSTLTACGLQIKNLSFAVREVHPDMQLCQRKACIALLS